MSKSIIIAGAHSGAGKTTLSLGIMHALHLRGLRVQGFKIGPDYIDTHWQQQATARPSHNLDEYMLGADTVSQLFHHYSQASDINILEGVAGLYDGFGLDPRFCSTFGMAHILQIPIVLVIDGKAAATSLAAVVQGFMHFQKNVPIVGVILNRINSDYHYEWVKQAIEHHCNIEVLGRLENNSDLQLAERQLGLSQEQAPAHYWSTLAQKIEQQVELDRLLALAQVSPAPYKASAFAPLEKASKRYRLAVAKDAAFWFYYQANFDLIRHYGAEIVFFSPLHDQSLPACDAVYIGGGFPERFAQALSANHTMLESLRQAHQANKAIYAEGGGAFYLSQSLKINAKETYPMAGIVPVHSEMTDTLQNFGYTLAKARSANNLLPIGESLRGHEFHYGRFCAHELASALTHYKKRDSKVLRQWSGGLQIGSCLVSLMHIHFWQKPSLIPHWFNNI